MKLTQKLILVSALNSAVALTSSTWLRLRVPESIALQVMLIGAIHLWIRACISRRLSEIVAGCDRISQGVFDQPVRPSGNDELSRLAEALNRAVDSFPGMLEARDLHNQELAAAARLASLGEMAGGVAHEINNPLGIILGRLEQLSWWVSDDDRDTERGAFLIKSAIDGVERIQKIIGNLRFFCRDSGTDLIEIVQLNSIVRESLDLCAERFRSSGIDLRIDCKDPIRCQCRPSQILQVIMSLLNNAYDAVELLETKSVQVTLASASSQAILTVTDSGEGIPVEIADKIMSPFFTTKPVGKGTGLGLSISKGIIEAHHGRLWLDRTCPNTRFVIELPIFNDLEYRGSYQGL